MREDLPELVAAFATALHDVGIPMGTDRAARFARAITALAPSTTRQLRHCALATLISNPDQVPAFDTLFRAVFEAPVDPAGQRGQGGDPSRALAGAVAEMPTSGGWGRAAAAAEGPTLDGSGRAAATSGASTMAGTGRPGPEINVPALASAVDRLSTRDFAELSAEELALLTGLMREVTLRTPVRPSRRRRPAPHGVRIDLRRTLTAARRTGGHPARLRRFNQRPKPRKLVVLCDISGSMQPYARAMLQLLYCAAGGARAEVFTFATRLTRLSPVLRRARPSIAIERAGHTAPDWSSGTRIASCLAEFNRRYGRCGMARGAVILIVSDGWDTDHPAELGRHMAWLSRVAFRIVWANPRTASPRYRPLAGGMAAAWPHCDAVVSAHNLNALDALTQALADPIRRRHAAPCPVSDHRQ